MDKSKQTSLTSHFKPLSNTMGNDQHFHSPPVNGDHHHIKYNHPKQNKPVHGNHYYDQSQKQLEHKEHSSFNRYRNPLDARDNFNSARPLHHDEYSSHKTKDYNNKNQHNVYQKPRYNKEQHHSSNRNFDQYKYREGQTESNHKSGVNPHYTHVGESKNPNIVWSTKPITIQPKVEPPKSLNKPATTVGNSSLYKSPEIKELEDALGKKKVLMRSLDLKQLPDVGKKLKDQIENLKSKLEKARLRESTNPSNAKNVQKNFPGNKYSVKELQYALQKKKDLMKSVDLKTLPDGGRKLQDQIANLESKLEEMKLKVSTSASELPKNVQIVPQYKSPEAKQLEYTIEEKKGLMRSLDLQKLPDGGKRLKDQIENLKSELEKVKLKDLANPPQPSKTTTEQKINDVTSKLEVIDLTTSESDKYNQRPYNEHQYYGGRMTVQRITTVAKVTTEAIESLHESLETCPAPVTKLKDPKGLRVTLMTHQCQALAWMVWRESQLMSGGILADDMGLGKTLTMIALILKQNELQSEKKLKLKAEESSGNKECKIKSEKKEVGEENVEENKVKETEVVGGTLIVAPASLIFHWECEINNRCDADLLNVHLFHGNKREKTPEFLAKFDIVITTYNLVRSCYGKLDTETEKTKSREVEDTLFQVKWKRIILDESHQIKNYKSQTSVAACALSAHSRWAMSGTPVQNDESDMFAMIKFLHCKPFDEYKLWKNQVSNKTYRGQQRLKTLVSCFVLRREKSQNGVDGKPIVDLPTRTFKTHKLQLNKVEQEVYDKLKMVSQEAFTKYEKNKQTKPYQGQNASTSHYFDSKSNKDDEKKFTSTTLLVMLLRLRQCCGHLSLLKNKFDTDLLDNEKKEIAVEDLFSSMSIENSTSPFNANQMVEKDKLQYFDISSTSSKIKFVMDKLNLLNLESPDDKCVIISQWTSMLNVLAHHLKMDKFSFAVIDGSVSAKKRMDLVNSFNKARANPKVMLVSLQAGGVGLNLVGGNHLFLIDMHWNPALEKQAFDRIYRVGQKKKVFVHKFVVEKTVEEQILKLQERKLSIANSVMEGADRDNKVKLSLADMKSLFGIN